MTVKEGWSLIVFGYTSDELAPQSNKPIIVVCDGCGAHRVVPKYAYRDLCQSCAQKKRCEDPAHRERMVVASKKAWADPARRQLRITSLKKACESPADRERRSRAQKKVWEDPMYGQMRSNASKKTWQSPTYRARRNAAMKKTWSNQELRDKQSVVQTNRWADSSAREKASAAAQGIPYDEWEAFAKDRTYCPKFNERCRESNREKYDRRCFLSGKTEEENGQKLSVHHYDMNKAQGCDGHTWKLVPLCRKLHSTSHTPTWVARIQYLLNHVWNPWRNNVIS